MKNLETNVTTPHFSHPEQLIMDHCPACYETLKPQASECFSCGVVLEHFQRVATEKRLKLTIGGLYHLSSQECLDLEAAWAKVESVYFDQQMHQRFLHLCLKLKSLPFAAKKYAERLALNTHDEIASHMKVQVMGLALESLPHRSQNNVAEDSVMPIYLLRLLTVCLVIGVSLGAVMMLISVLTTHQFFYLGFGTFITVSSLLCYLFLQRWQRQRDF